MNTIQNYISPYFKLFGLVSLLGFFNACSSSQLEPDSKTLGYDYFPLAVGYFVEYQVDESKYELLGNGIPVSQESYQIREEMNQLFIDIEGGVSVKVNRFRRAQVGDEWQLDSVWVAKRTASQAFRVENNQTYLKLIFPTKNGTTWNGNAYNALGKNTSEIADFNKSYSLGKFNFDKTLKVIQANDSSLVSMDKRIEMYAQGVGLISRELNQVTYCYSDNCRGQGKIDFGKISKQKIINYGNQ